MGRSLFLKDMNNKKIRIIIDKNDIQKYAKYYFSLHPKASKLPLRYPFHPSINEWMILKRPMMNTLKQKWKDFIVWHSNEKGYANLHINKCRMKFCVFYETNRRHDVDNTVPKFILDGMVLSGTIEDDDVTHITELILTCSVDKDHPRTEIYIEVQE